MGTGAQGDAGGAGNVGTGPDIARERWEGGVRDPGRGEGWREVRREGKGGKTTVRGGYPLAEGQGDAVGAGKCAQTNPVRIMSDCGGRKWPWDAP